MYTNDRIGNMANFINIVRQGGNPEQMVMNMLQQKAQQGNPMFANMINLVQTGNVRELENIARNITRERGVDFDTEFNSFKQKLGF